MSPHGPCSPAGRATGYKSYKNTSELPPSNNGGRNASPSQSTKNRYLQEDENNPLRNPRRHNAGNRLHPELKNGSLRHHRRESSVPHQKVPYAAADGNQRKDTEDPNNHTPMASGLRDKPYGEPEAHVADDDRTSRRYTLYYGQTPAGRSSIAVHPATRNSFPSSSPYHHIFPRACRSSQIVASLSDIVTSLSWMIRSFSPRRLR